jgi:hypothetical protein
MVHAAFNFNVHIFFLLGTVGHTYNPRWEDHVCSLRLEHGSKW